MTKWRKMDKKITREIRIVLKEWNTISDVCDNIKIEGVTNETIMQIISRMKRNGEVVSKDIDLYDRIVKSYRLSK